MADRQSDPAEIEREIERTRAELSETIDAIADKVSPKRAVARTADRVKQAVKGDGHAQAAVVVSENGQRAAVVAEGSGASPASAVSDSFTKASLSRLSSSPVSTFLVERKLRVDRVAMAAGAVVAIALSIVLVRRRRGDG